MLALCVGLLAGARFTEDACDQAVPTQRELSQLERDDWLVATRCTLTLRNGTVFEGTEIH